MGNDLTSSFALDVNAVTRLKYSPDGHGAKGEKQVAKQFEAMFLQQMLKSMRKAIPKSGLLKSAAGDDYQQMMDAQWAQTLAQRGIGLADMLTRQLNAHGHGAAKHAGGDQTTDPLAGFAHAAPKALHASDPVAALNAQRVIDTGSKPAAHSLFADGAPVVSTDAGQPLFSLAAGTKAADRSDAPEYVSQFIKRMGPAASAAAAQSGLPRELILAQAALESGWGRHEITQSNGQSSHNIFNIKATGWSGDKATVGTTEYDHGVPRATQAGFRVYGSYDQAFSDYARLLSQSPRYAPVLRATTARAAAQALQDCGYATDPAYARKLVSIMQRIPAESSSGLFANDTKRPVVDLAARSPAASSGSLLASVDRGQDVL
ncbi:MAG: flagellar assembly peptidoglycan hydrolase FlgJ [Salinisphaera sp.]|jgi:flagellar protein FlgJ|nr:flagellar assembly peptidoglycan hydrolase FlgJ [Salinisphaera sp.]